MNWFFPELRSKSEELKPPNISSEEMNHIFRECFDLRMKDIEENVARNNHLLLRGCR